jgi:hypothetical protein
LGTDGDNEVRAWATLISPYADDDQGFQALPEVGSQVVVAFEAGNLRRPYIVGACWNGREAMPVQPEAANNKRVIKSRAKSILEFDDTQGAAKITLKLESGHKGAGRLGPDRHPDPANGSVGAFTASGQIESRPMPRWRTLRRPSMCTRRCNFDGLVNFTTLTQCRSGFADVQPWGPEMSGKERHIDETTLSLDIERTLYRRETTGGRWPRRRPIIQKYASSDFVTLFLEDATLPALCGRGFRPTGCLGRV